MRVGQALYIQILICHECLQVSSQSYNIGKWITRPLSAHFLFRISSWLDSCTTSYGWSLKSGYYYSLPLVTFLLLVNGNLVFALIIGPIRSRLMKFFPLFFSSFSGSVESDLHFPMRFLLFLFPFFFYCTLLHYTSLIQHARKARGPQGPAR